VPTINLNRREKVSLRRGYYQKEALFINYQNFKEVTTMPRWSEERLQMILLSHHILKNPFAYFFGMWLLGMLGGVYLWVIKPLEARLEKLTEEPKQLKTALDYAKWGYQVMDKDMLGIRQSGSAAHKANCKKALPYFEKAISLDSKLGLAYQGRGMSLICQNNKLSGRKSLNQAKSLYLQQGLERNAKDIDLILSVYK
jgi:hypothetical protein